MGRERRKGKEEAEEMDQEENKRERRERGNKRSLFRKSRAQEVREQSGPQTSFHMFKPHHQLGETE